MTRYFFSLLILLGVGNSLFAQNAPNWRVYGNVADSTSGQRIEFATLTVVNAKDSAVVTGGMTDEKGIFDIEIPRPGVFFIKISFIGYYDRNIGPVKLDKKDGMDLGLGTVKLKAAETVLEATEVVAEKPLVTNAIDRKVFSADKLATAAGGSANDVLQSIPSVEIDQDGAITMRGTGNVNILIDGKPVSISGASKQAILDQIPASSIESIEVITNPSAKFDPDGVSGILNIVLKKNRKKGVNGNVSVGAGTGNKYNASGQIGYRDEKWNGYANYSFRKEDAFTNGYSFRENFRNDTLTSVFDQDNDGLNKTMTHLGKMGLEFFFNRKTQMSMSGTFGNTRRDNNEVVTTSQLDGQRILYDYFTRQTLNNSNAYNADGNVYFRREFATPQQYWTLDLTQSWSRNTTDRDFDQLFYDLDLNPLQQSLIQQANNEVNRVRTTTLQTDYAHPTASLGQFDMGLKGIFRNIDQNFMAYNFDTLSQAFYTDSLLSNHFVFDEKIISGYGSWARSFGKFGIQAGLRLEQALTHSDLITTGEYFDNNYFSWFPSVFFKYEFTPQQILQLSYSRRINRPSVEQLNPFPDYSDPLNLFKGNPFIQPEYINAFELGYSHYWKGFSIQPSAYFRLTQDQQSRYISVDTATNLTTISFANFNTGRTIGADITITGQPKPWWNFTFSSSNYYETVDARNVIAEWAKQSRFTWSMKLTSTWSIKKILDIQVSGSYRSPMVRPQGQIDPVYFVDAAVTLRILKGKGAISLRVSDIFDTREFNIHLDDVYFNRSIRRKRESLIGFLTFTYRFGTGEGKKIVKKKQEENVERGDF